MGDKENNIIKHIILEKEGLKISERGVALNL